MLHTRLALFGSVASFAVIAIQPSVALAADPSATQPPAASDATEIIVTAQKREEKIQKVGMSIAAVSGDKLTELGINDVTQLQKIVPGFRTAPTIYGTTVFTIRGVGFLTNDLAASPTVTVYQDEAPLPYSALAQGTTLDTQRVEVLKGPQGTLYGENATGGAINFIANKPTDSFDAGIDVTVGNFSTANVKGFVSGPITDTLDGRIAIESDNSGAWQEGYGPQAGQTIGGTDFLTGRVSLLWNPSDDFKGLLTVNGWRDRGYSQESQVFRHPLASPALDPAITAYPLAPHNDQAAGWNSCINTDPYNPIAGQSLGTTYPTPNGRRESEGPGSVAWAGGQPIHCVPPRKDNIFYSGTLRMDYDLQDDLSLTSLTSYQKFHRFAGVDATGVPYEDYNFLQTGGISVVYQELRLAGRFQDEGHWVVGGNYQYDETADRNLGNAAASSNDPFGPFALGPTAPNDNQQTTTIGLYGSGEYPILDNLTLLGGLRYTKENKTAEDCFDDGGDGTYAFVSSVLSPLFGGTGAVKAAPGGCATLGPDGNPYVTAPHFKLDQNNVAWKAGLNWQVDPDTLLYVSVNQGYKGGSFPGTVAVTYKQLAPVVQEGLLAYEAGFKTQQFDRTLTLDGAFFYYDYTDKQVQGAISVPVFGALPALVNVPQSHVVGFELSGAWTPDFLKGLTVTPSLSYQHSQIDKSGQNQCKDPAIVAALAAEHGSPSCRPGHFYGYDAFSTISDFTGEGFPQVPEVQASIDAAYEWEVRDALRAYVGATFSYTSDTNSFFTNDAVATRAASYDPLAVSAYALLDLRAGIETDAWRFQVYGRNVTNTYYWTTALHALDTFVRLTGMPATYGAELTYRF